VATLETLRDELACEASCVAFLNESGRRIERVIAARSTFAICNPEVLTDVAMAEFPWLDENLQHLRVRGIADTADPPAAQAADAARLALLGCGAVLLIGFDVHGRRGGFMALFFSQPQSSWNAEHTLLLKLLGSSFATGFERLQSAVNLARRDEREALLERTVNDGTWDFDAVNNRVEYSPRWKAMMGYSDEDLARSAPDWRRIVHVDDYARLQAKAARAPGRPHRDFREHPSHAPQGWRVALGCLPRQGHAR
jgi:PAS domain-containing protein